MACLYAVVEPLLNPPDVEVKLVGEAAFVNMNLPGHSKTYGKYFDAELSERIPNITRNISRLDLNFDIH